MSRLGSETMLRGSPLGGLSMATFALFAGLTTIVFYGVAGPTFKEALALTGGELGLLLSSPHISKAFLRIPFGAWVDQVGGRKPFIVLLSSSCLGLAGVAGTLLLYYPERLDVRLFPALVVFGFIGGAGGAAFSVGIPQTSYWFPRHRQGWALGVYAGIGNIGPGAINLVVPVLIDAVGLTGAYSAWFIFMMLATLTYIMLAVDPYYFQLNAAGVEPDRARTLAAARGQEMFPSGNAWASLKRAALTARTWVLVMLYAVSFGGGFTALAAWFPTYWHEYHHLSLLEAGALGGAFVAYGSIIRVPGGSLSDRLGGEIVAVGSFLVMACGALVLTFATTVGSSVLGMAAVGTGMGLANAAIFKLVPIYVPDAIGGASGWIGGVGGLGTLVVLPILGFATDVYGEVGYARGFLLFVVLALLSAAVALVLVRRARRRRADPPPSA